MEAPTEAGVVRILRSSGADHRTILRVAAAAGMAVLLALAFGVAHGRAPENSPRNAVVKEIKDYADRHARNEAPLATGTIITIFKDNKVGLTPQEIADIYETEYERVQRSELPAYLTSFAGWAVAAILFLVVVFHDGLKRGADWLIDQIAGVIYCHFAGSRLLRRTALKRYRTSILQKYSLQPLTFRPHKPLDLRRIFVPLALQGASHNEQIDALEASLNIRRLMVVGSPGSGKSVLLKHLVLRYTAGGLSRRRSSHASAEMPIHGAR
jgi:hypothetical protein